MRGKISLALAAIFLFVANTDAAYRLCANTKYSQECQAIERGSSQVVCTFVTDSVDCLMKMEKNEADFTVLSGEETLMSALSQSDKLKVLASVRNQDRQNQKYAFQSVALVKNTHKGGLGGLSGGAFCHPGYSKGKEQLWSDRVLKYFERKVAMTSRKCAKDSMSSAEDDAHELTRFFSAACRPGSWVQDATQDANLKTKFPTLCSLCTVDGTSDCSKYTFYSPYSTVINSHISAINCVTMNRGTVAYVAYEHVMEYFKKNVSEMANYALLCESGTLSPLNSNSDEAPCAWIKQPWGSLISRAEVSENLLKDIRTWMPNGRYDGLSSWVDSLDSILFNDKTELFQYEQKEINAGTYIDGRPLPVSETECHSNIKWCTINDQEYNKCEWIKRAALTIGMTPEVTCVKGTSYIDCLSLIKQDRADFISIDSNYGYIARKFYDMDVILYHETTRALSSKVLAIIKEINNSSITRFENLRDKNACFPEYAGIAWVAFIRAAHERKVINPNECDYAYEIGNFFSGACAPGATDPAHFPSKALDPSKLCASCRGFSPRGRINEQGVVDSTRVDIQECPANANNKFYGVKGALRCLLEPDSNVAFIEGQNLEEIAAQFENVKSSDFRVLCRNGSLASNPGFAVDDNCALSVTVDSEIVGKRTSQQLLNIQLFLQELDALFGYTSGMKLINFEVFSEFDKIKDLLFKDTTIGLDTADSKNEKVINYVELFKHIESCTKSSGITLVSSLFLTFVSVVLLQIFKQ